MSEEIYNSLRSKLEQKPNSLAFARLAELLYQANNKDTAFALLEKGLSQNPNYITGYLVMAELYYNSGQNDKAKELYRKILEIDPFNIAALANLAKIALEAEQYSIATAHLMQILSIDPHNKTAFDIIAQNYSKIEQEIPTIFEEQVEELPPVEIEAIGGGVFSLIGVEPAVDIKPLPIISKESAVELTVLENIVETPPMQPVEMNEVPQETEDIVQLDDIFKAFEPPKPVVKPKKIPEKPKEPEEKLEIDASYFPDESPPNPEVAASAGEEESAPEVEIDLGFETEIIEKEPTVEKTAPIEEKVPSLVEEPDLSWDEEKPAVQKVPEKTVETGQEKTSEKVSAEPSEGELVLDIQGDIFKMEPDEEEPAENAEAPTVAEMPPEQTKQEIETNEDVSMEKTKEGIIEQSVSEQKIPEQAAEIVEEHIAETETQIPETSEISTETEEAEENIPDEIELPDKIFSFDEESEETLGGTETIEETPVSTEQQPLQTSAEQEQEKISGIFATQESEEISEPETPIEETTSEKEKLSTAEPKKPESISQEQTQDEKANESIKLPDEIFKMEDDSSQEKVLDITSQIAQEQSQPAITGEGEIDGKDVQIPEQIFAPTEQDTEQSFDVNKLPSTEQSETAVPPKPQNQEQIEENEQTAEKVEPEKMDSSQSPDALDALEIPENIVPMADLMGDENETPEENLQETSRETVGEIETEEIEGFQTTRASDFAAPEDIESISGLDKREDFTPPEDTIEIEGLEQRPENVLGDISMDELENLLGDSERTVENIENLPEKEAAPEQPHKITAPPKDIATATTAEIFAAQGMTDKAIKIYEQLLAKSNVSDEDRQKFLARIKILKMRANK